MEYIFSCSLDFLLKHMESNILTSFNEWLDFSSEFSFYMKSKPFAHQIISLGAFGKIFVPIYCNGSTLCIFKNDGNQYKSRKVIVKSIKCEFNQNKPVSREENKNFYYVDKNVAETYFACFISYIHKIEVCPFLCNYVASYVCRKRQYNKYKIMTFSEKYSMELGQFIKLPQFDELYTITFLFQFIYTIYILKVHLGMIHFDTHLRNVMVTKSSENNNYKYYMFYDKFKKIGILIPYLNFNLKLIDFGLCSIDLKNSMNSDLKSDFKMYSVKEKESFYTTGRQNTAELQYFLLHLWQHVKSEKIKKIISNFCECFYGNEKFNPENILKNNKTLVLENGQCIIKNHDVGLTDSKIQTPCDLMNQLIEYCKMQGSTLKLYDSTVFSFLKLNNVPSFEEILVVHPFNEKKINYRDCPNTEIQWYRPSFFSLSQNMYGHYWMFPTHIHNPKRVSIKPRMGFILKICEKDILTNDAYMRLDPNLRIDLNNGIQEKSVLKKYLCGKFLIHKNQSVVFDFHLYGQLFFCSKQNNFVIIYFTNLVNYYIAFQYFKSKNFDFAVDVSNFLIFVYEKEEFSNRKIVNELTKDNILYISF